MTGRADAIMDAAERRIRNAGYSGFSFREIAEEIGVKSASVHYHFPTKEALAAAVARRYSDRFMVAVDDAVEHGGTMLDAWIAGFRRAVHEDGGMCLCGALAVAAPDLPPEVRAEARRFFQLGLARLRDGGLTTDRATQVLAVLEGGMMLATALEDPSAFDAAAAGLS